MIPTFKKDDYVFHKRLRKTGRVLLVDESSGESDEEFPF